MHKDILYIGAKTSVTAVDKITGEVIWTTRLKSGITCRDAFVSLLVEGDRVYAHTAGELFCLNANNGDGIWKNTLPGLGYGIATLATAMTAHAQSSVPHSVAEEERSESSHDASNSHHQTPTT